MKGISSFINRHNKRIIDVLFLVVFISAIFIDVFVNPCVGNITQSSIAITCTTTIISIVITVSISLYNKEIATLSYQELSQLIYSHYSMLEMIIITIISVAAFTGAAVARLDISMIVVDVEVIVYAVIFSIQNIPILMQREKTIRKIIKKAEKENREVDKANGKTKRRENK